MPSQVRPDIPIMLDKKRHLRFDMNAMVSFEEATGKNYLKLDYADMTAGEVRALIWAMLLQEDNTLTQKQVGSWLNQISIPEMARYISKAIEAAVPRREGKEKIPLARAVDKAKRRFLHGLRFGALAGIRFVLRRKNFGTSPPLN